MVKKSKVWYGTKQEAELLKTATLACEEYSGSGILEASEELDKAMRKLGKAIVAFRKSVGAIVWRYKG